MENNMKLKKLFRMKLIMLVVLCFTAIQLNAQLAPNLVYPFANDSCIVVDEPVQFAWDTVSGAYGYRIEISSSATWTTADIADEYLSHPTSTFSIAFSGYNTNYYWRVRSTFFDTSFVTATRRFTTKGTFPVLIAPSNLQTCVELNPVFEWATIAGATGYRFQIAYTDSFPVSDLIYQNLAISSTTDPSRTLSVNLQHHYRNYYWRVAANYGTCQSDWSDAFVFSSKQAIPTVTFPPENSNGIKTNTILSWSNTGPSSVYDVQLASDANFNNIIHNFVGLTSTTTSIDPLETNRDYFWKLQSRVLSCASGWSATKKFKTEFNPPVLDLPYEGRICLDLTYQFKWLQVLGAQSYHIQIAEDSLFNTIAYQQEGIFDLGHIVPLTKGLTRHYWRVRAKDNNNVGRWSDVRTFKTSLNVVEPINPPLNSAGVKKSLIMRWKDVANGQGIYNLQISLSPTFADTLFNHSNVSSTTFSITLPQYNKEYYWRVSAEGEHCSVGYSSPWKFRTIIDKPTLLDPPDLSNDEPYSIFFQWTNVDSATHYEFYLSLNSNFIPVVYGTDLCPKNHIYVSGLEPDHKYYWRVRAVNKSGMSDYSSIFSFTTTPLGATVPELLSPPIATEQVLLNPMLSWKAADRAKRYHLQVSDSSNFVDKMVDIDTLQVTFYQLNGLKNDKTYFWRVSAINDSGETNWSKLGWFNTLMTIPQDEPELVAPHNDSMNANVKIVLSWHTVKYANAFELEIAKNEAFTQGLIQDTLIYTTDKLIGNLENSTKYYWRVRAKNLSGKGPWALPYSFTTKEFVSVKDELTNKYNVKSYPNPFNNDNFLSFTLNKREQVIINVYDMTGKELINLSNEMMNEGEHTVKWSPANMQSGTYFYSIQIGDLKSYQEVNYIK
jgi:hypothetical protein